MKKTKIYLSLICATALTANGNVEPNLNNVIKELAELREVVKTNGNASQSNAKKIQRLIKMRGSRYGALIAGGAAGAAVALSVENRDKILKLLSKQLNIGLDKLRELLEKDKNNEAIQELDSNVSTETETENESNNNE